MRGLVITPLVLVAACTVPEVEYACEMDSDCSLDGRAGLCESTKFCSFESSDCATGREYGPHSGALTGTCVARDQVLVVTLPRSDRGRVTSTPPGIDCPGSCEAAFPFGASVTLEATADSGSTFGGFAGDCTAAMCSVTLDVPRAVQAKFWSGDVQRARTLAGTSYADEGRSVVWGPDGALYSSVYHLHAGISEATFFEGTPFEQTHQGGGRGFVVRHRDGAIENVAHFPSVSSYHVLAATPTGPILGAVFYENLNMFIRQVMPRGGGDTVVARLSANLAAADWVRTFSGVGTDPYDGILGIASDAAGDVYVVVSLEENTSIDPCNEPGLPSVTPCLISGGQSPVFVVKLSGTSGATLATIMLSNVMLGGIAAHPDGGVVLAGRYMGEVSATPPSPGAATTILSAPAVADGFVLRLDGGLQPMVPAFKFGGTSASYSEVSAVAVTGTGDILIGGLLGSTVDIGYGPVEGNALMVARLTSTLAPSANGWVRRIPATAARIARLVVDVDENVVIGGSFDTNINPAGTPIVTQGQTNTWMAKFVGGTGEPVWTRAFGTDGATWLHGLDVNASGTIAITGSFDRDLPAAPSPTLVGAGFDLAYLMEVTP